MWLLLAGLLLAVPALAHSPFGSSTRAVLTTNYLEIYVTTGEALAVPILEDVPAEARRPAAPGLPYPLPNDIAGRLYAVTNNGQPLAAERVALRMDGADFEFGLIYPRPTGLLLDFKAVYLETPEATGVAPLTLSDEDGRPFISALLSKGQNTMTVALPTAADTPAAKTNTSATTTPPTFREFLTLGIQHMLTGLDHLLHIGPLDHSGLGRNERGRDFQPRR